MKSIGCPVLNHTGLASRLTMRVAALISSGVRAPVTAGIARKGTIPSSVSINHRRVWPIVASSSLVTRARARRGAG